MLPFWGPPHPFCHTLMPFSHFSLRNRWFYFLLLWVILRTRSGCDDGWKKYLTLHSSVCFHHNGPIWKASIGTGTMFTGLHQPLNDQGIREVWSEAGRFPWKLLLASAPHTRFSFHVGMCLFIIGSTQECRVAV